MEDKSNYIGQGTPINSLLGGQQQMAPPQQQPHPQQLYEQYPQDPSYYQQQQQQQVPSPMVKPVSTKKSFEQVTGLSVLKLVFTMFLFVVLSSSWVIAMEKRIIPISFYSPSECPPLLLVVINALLFGLFFVLYSWGEKRQA